MPRRAAVRRRRVCIDYGPPGREKKVRWPITVTDARRNVTITGNLAAALRAHPGVTIGCALSEFARENAEAFGHPVLLVSVNPSNMVVVDRQDRNGQPTHGVRYLHSYGRTIVDNNDTGALRALAREKPGLVERDFILRAPKARRQVPGTHDHGNRANPSTTRRVFVPRGALRRAVKAGLIGEHVAEQMTRIARSR